MGGEDDNPSVVRGVATGGGMWVGASRAMATVNSRSRIRLLVMMISGLVLFSMFEDIRENIFLAGLDVSPDQSVKSDGNKIPSGAKPPWEQTSSATSPQVMADHGETQSSTSSPSLGKGNYSLDNISFYRVQHASTSTRAIAFTNRWCDLSQVQWYPDTKHSSWQQLEPHFLIPGAKYSGTSILGRMLSLHPNLQSSRPSETQFFLDGVFRRRFVTPEEKTIVKAARTRMYAAHYSRRGGALANTNRTTITAAFDASPGYLFYSSLLPRRILCVIPWVKLVVLLRDPLDRIYFQFQAAKRYGLDLTFEAWIENDFRLAQSVGLISPALEPLNVTTKAIREVEDLAWYKYSTQPGGGSPIGRSIYDIQLRHWFQALQAAGKKPSANVMIVWTERLAESPAAEFKRILDFLGIPLPTDVSIESSLTSLAQVLSRPPSNTISPGLRLKLEKFYTPYKQRLKQLLRQNSILSGHVSASSN